MPQLPSESGHSIYPVSNDPPYIVPSKATAAPIEIPRRRRPVVSRNLSSSIGQSTSPDLIFEMSPVSSEFPSPGCYAFSFAAPKEQEPFMYHFPVLGTRLHSDSRTQPTSTDTVYSSSVSTPSIPNAKHRRSPLCQVNVDDTPTPPCTATKVMSTTKITGFAPPMQQLLPTQIPCSVVRPLKTSHLSPPPRSSSYSSSPWILPGKNDVLEEESTSLDMDPGALEFERHLMQRIENQNPLRFRTLPFVVQ